MKRLWKAGAVVVALLALAGAAGGLVVAQSGDETPAPTAGEQATATPDGPADDGSFEKENRKDAFLDALAANLGVTREQLDEALTQTALDMVDQALEDGRITEEQATKIRDRIESGEFPDFFHRGPDGFGHRFGHGPGRGHYLINEVAEFLGVERGEVVSGLAQGDTLAEIAAANGSSADALAAFLLTELQEKLAQAVENGRIDQERADEILANAPERINDLINREGPLHPRGMDGDREATPDGASLIF